MKARHLSEAILVLLVCASIGCSANGEGTDVAPSTQEVRSESTTAIATTEDSTSTTVEHPSPEPLIPDTAALTLITTTDDLGERPQLEWAGIADAAEYVVVVNSPDGGPYWTWSRAGTAVRLGGGPLDDADTTGARLLSAKTWFVVAFDGAGHPIASSERGDLRP